MRKMQENGKNTNSKKFLNSVSIAAEQRLCYTVRELRLCQKEGTYVT